MSLVARPPLRSAAWLFCLALAASVARAQEDGGPPPDASVIVAADAGVDTDGGAAPDGGRNGLRMDPVAQSDLWGATIGELVVEAPPGLDEATARQLLGLRRGDRLDAAAVRRAVRRLVLLAKLDDVRIFAVPLYEGRDSVRLIVQLIPSSVVREVRFEGIGNVPPSALRRTLPIGEGDSLDARGLAAAQDAMKQAMALEGYPLAEVTTSSEPLDKGAVALVIRVRAGPPQLIGKVTLQGDTRYPESVLLEEAGLARGQIASRTRLDDAAARLLTWYREKGHYGAKVEPQPFNPAARGYGRIPISLRVDAGPRWVVVFRGNHRLRSSALESRLGLPPDRRLDDELAARLEERIATAYREIGYHHVKVRARAAPGTEKGTRRLVFLIKEGPLTELRSVRLQGATGIPERQLVDEAVLAAAEGLSPPANINQHIDQADVDAILSSGDSEAESYPQDQDPRVRGKPEYPRAFISLVDAEKVYDHQRFQAGARAVEDVYRSKGYLQPRVQGPLATYSLDGAIVDVKYKVTEGVQSIIRTVSFRGNQNLESAVLLEVVRTGAEKLRVEPGAPLDLFAVEEARLALQKHYANHGFPYTRIEDVLEGDRDRRQVDLVYIIDEGPLVRIKDVVFRGNDVTRTIVLSRQMTLEEGDIFRLREVEESRRRLLNLGLFASVAISLAEGEEGSERTLLVEVRERGRGDIEFGPGASVEQGPRGAFAYNVYNIGGLGVTHGGRARVNWPYPGYYFPTIYPEIRETLIRRFDDTNAAFLRPLRPDVYDAVNNRVDEGFSYYQGPHPKLLLPLLHTEAEIGFTLGYPKIPFIPWETALRSEALAVRANRLAYTMTKAALVFGGDVKAPPLRYLRASTSPTAGVQITQLNCWPVLPVGATGDVGAAPGRTCAADFSAATRRLDNGWLALTTLRLPITIDGRDDIFKPHAGYLATAAVDVVFGGGVLLEGQGAAQQVTPVRSTFLRVQGGITGYMPFTDLLTGAVSVRGGSIFPIGPDDTGTLPHYVPLFERFYLGGSDSVRGFQQEGVLPSDDDTDPSEPRPVVSQGGNIFWNLRSELRFPIAGPLEGAVFLDAGQLLLDWQNWDPSKFSAGIGSGVRVNTPVGPLVLDVAFGAFDGVRGLGIESRRFVVHPAIGYF